MKKFSTLFLLLVLCCQASRAQIVTQSYSFGTPYDAATSVAADQQGNLFISGTFSLFGPSAPWPYESLRKVDPAGNIVWSVGSDDWGHMFRDLATDLAGNCYVLGTYSDTLQLPGGQLHTGPGGLFLAKYNGGGVLQWSRTIDGNGVNYYSTLKTDGAGNLIVAGRPGSINPGTTHLMSFGNNFTTTALSFVAKFDASGNTLWAVGIEAQLKDAAVNASGQIAVAGDLTGPLSIGASTFATPVYGIFSATLSPAGTLTWQNRIAAEYFGRKEINALTIGAAGEVFVTGEYINSSNNFSGTILPAGSFSGNTFLLKYNSAGATEWIKPISVGMGDFSVKSMITDSDGNCLLAADFSSTIDIQGHSFTPNGIPNNGGDFILVSFTPAGDYSWAVQGGDNGLSYSVEDVADLAIDANDNLYLCGYVMLTFGPYALNIQLGNQICQTSGAFGFKVRTGDVNALMGTVFYDLNSNGIKDATDSNATDFVVQVQSGSLNYTMPNNNGQYNAYVETGNYTVTIPSGPIYYTPAPVSHSGNFVTVGNTIDSLDFAMQPIPGMQDLMVMVYPGTVPRPGFPYLLYVIYKNVGTVTLSGSVELNLDAMLAFQNSSPAANSQTGSTLTWNFANLQPMQNGTIVINTTVPATANLGNTITQLASISPLAGDLTPADNSDSYTAQIVGSYDPNDKQVSSTWLHPTEVADGKWLEYTIRFQNTGTDTAFTVRIADTLSALLNVPTIEMLASSHPYILSLKANSVLEWQFNNILLPDSNTNEAASHGFVTYRIKPKTDLVLGDLISNTAHIYFDFNEAIIPNTAYTVVSLVASKPEPETNPLHIYPNPNKGTFTVQCSNIWQPQVEAELCNVLGQTVWQQNLAVENGKLQKIISTNNLSKGVYYLQLKTDKGSKAQKVIIE